MDRIQDFLMSPSMEVFLFPSKKIEINLDLWKPGDHNILYITALSGSGKTTLATSIAKEHNAILFTTDDIWNKGEYGTNESKELCKYLRKKFPKYDDYCTKGTPLGNDVFVLLDELLRVMHNDSKHLYIIEGIEFFECDNGEEFSEEPLIVLGTSAVKSLLQRLGREHPSDNGGIDWSAALKDEFIQCVRWYIDSERLLDKFRKRIKVHLK